MRKIIESRFEPTADELLEKLCEMHETNRIVIEHLADLHAVLRMVDPQEFADLQGGLANSVRELADLLT